MSSHATDHLGLCEIFFFFCVYALIAFLTVRVNFLLQIFILFGIMDEDDVIALSNYLLHRVYPEGFTRDDKRSLRQKASSFVCEPGWYNLC